MITWWASLSRGKKLWPLFAVVAYWFTLFFLGGFRNDHFKLGLAVLVLSYGGRVAQILLEFLTPLILTAVIYDSQRFYGDAIRGTIHVQEPYAFDQHYFGIHTTQGLFTPNEWLQLHTHPALDFVTGLAYLGFIGVYLAVCAYFRFWVTRTQPTRMPRAKSTLWGFFILNMLGYSTYYWFPAAPPWYVSLYGLGPVHLDALPNPAGCIRFDALFGTHFFSSFYGRSADVFGAVPSLHIAYPFLSVLYAFEFSKARVFCIAFFFIMCFSAVYLNHHYVLDLLWGMAYTLIVYGSMRVWADHKAFATTKNRGLHDVSSRRMILEKGAYDEIS